MGQTKPDNDSQNSPHLSHNLYEVTTYENNRTPHKAIEKKDDLHVIAQFKDIPHFPKYKSFQDTIARTHSYQFFTGTNRTPEKQRTVEQKINKTLFHATQQPNIDGEITQLTPPYALEIYLDNPTRDEKSTYQTKYASHNLENVLSNLTNTTQTPKNTHKPLDTFINSILQTQTFKQTLQTHVKPNPLRKKKTLWIPHLHLRDSHYHTILHLTDQFKTVKRQSKTKDYLDTLYNTITNKMQ